MTGASAIPYGQELRYLFDLHYDNIFSGASPGITDYEVSLYLTQAIREIILTLYSGTSSGASFDSDERMKSLLSGYTLDNSTTSVQFQTIPGLENTLKYNRAEIRSDVWFILKENLTCTDQNGNTKQVLIKPINHDEFWILVDNPFKRPDKYLSRAWRLDTSYSMQPSIEESRGVIIISAQEATPVAYNYTYLKRPEPIIISDFSDSGGNVVIEGITVASVNDINIPDSLIRDSLLKEYVVNRAVEIATRDYKQNNIESQVALNDRVL